MKGCGFITLEELNKNEALRYMGYYNKEPDSTTLAMVYECEKLLLKAIKPAFIYRAFDIETTDDGVAVLGTTLTLGGRAIAEHLAGCEKCILFAATLSIGADNTIRKLEATDMAKAVVADFLASAAVEQVCDRAEAATLEELTEYSNLHRTWRFSPGYGDLPLDIQGEFLSILDAPKRIGLSATENNILIPRKSVTAIIGLSSQNIPKKRQGCACCNMHDTCTFRKRGEHCGS